MTLNCALAKGVDQLKHIDVYCGWCYAMLLMLPWLGWNEANI